MIWGRRLSLEPRATPTQFECLAFLQDLHQVTISNALSILEKTVNLPRRNLCMGRQRLPALWATRERFPAIPSW